VGLLGCVALTVVLAWFGAATPPTYVEAGNAVGASTLATLRRHGALAEGERLRWFYSPGLWNVEEGYAALTDRRLLLYYAEVEPPLQEVAFAEITSVSMEGGGLLEDATCVVTTDAGAEFPFLLSTERGRAQRFVADLRAAVGAAGGTGAALPEPELRRILGPR
jgi:hypothetical protein